ncbi:MAG TPA: NAD(P)/FAD-dependent oxidoreductase [Gemmatimonadaceae bacterium]
MTTIPRRADVVVIGGGPAGSGTAAHLARSGVDVVLLEKVKHPRNTVGESLIPHFWKFADAIGASEKIRAAGFLEKAGGITVWKERIHQFSFRDFGLERPALHVERDRFDELLLRHSESSGARVFERVPVTSVDFADPEEPIVHYDDRRGGDSAPGEIRCKFVVDASGHSVVLGRQFGTRVIVGRGEREFMALWGYFRNARFVASDGTSHGAEELGATKPVTFVVSYEDGWTWHIILREHTSVGLVINTRTIKAMKKRDHEEYFRRTVEATPHLRALLETATFEEGSLSAMHDYSYYLTQVSGPGWFCVGDAGGFVDPVFSHGVQAALYNASVAGVLIKTSLDHPASAERNRRHFDARIRQYYGFSRSLALGDFGGDGVDASLVKSLMKQMPPIELELMLVASGITDRSTNFRNMAIEAGVLGELGDGFVSNRHRFLPALRL